MKKQRKKAFTLIELIVVITILAILGTIAMMAMNGYSSKARDSVRSSDVANVKKALEIFSVKTGNFPAPDASTPVTYGTEKLWDQGKVGDGVLMAIGSLDGVPVDPTTEQNYTYSKALYSNEYQVLMELENKDVGLINSAYASEEEKTPRLVGNYNGVFLTGSDGNIFAIPSMIADKFNLTNLETKFTLTGKKVAFKTPAPEVKKADLSGDEPKFAEFGEYLKTAYGSEEVDAYFATTPIYKEIAESTNYAELGKNVVIGELGASSEVITGDNTGCDIDFHLEEGECKSDIKPCDLSGGTGTMAWDGSDWGECTLSNCTENFHEESGECVSDTKACDIANGTGSQIWGESGWTTCALESCEDGYYSKNGACEIGLSCSDLKQKGLASTNGVYKIKPNNGPAFDAYCDMTTDGGGWTMVVAQYELDPVTDWNEGIQDDYDPSLVTTKGFALNTAQIPAGSNQVAFGKDLDATFVGYSDFVYTTGDIAKTTLYNQKDQKNYHIYRVHDKFYDKQDPESANATGTDRNNTFTYDEIGGVKYSWAFGPSNGIPARKGYAMLGENNLNSDDSYAWTVWVRESPTSAKKGAITNPGLSCKDILDNGGQHGVASADGAGYYIKPTLYTGEAYEVNCNMSQGGWTMVAAQFETDPATDWNEGIQSDYHPSWVNPAITATTYKKSFALNTSQIPAGSNQVAFGKDLDATFIGYSDFVYTTGDIAKNTLYNQKDNTNYHIHRDAISFYGSYDPEAGIANISERNNALTYDKSGGTEFSWAFTPKYPSSKVRGFNMNGSSIRETNQDFAWTVWVREGTVKRGSIVDPGLSCLDINGTTGEHGDGNYHIKPTGAASSYEVYCDMTNDEGGRTLLKNYSGISEDDLGIDNAKVTNFLSANNVLNIKYVTSDRKGLMFELDDKLADKYRLHSGIITNASCIDGSELTGYNDRNLPFDRGFGTTVDGIGFGFGLREDDLLSYNNNTGETYLCGLSRTKTLNSYFTQYDVFVK